MLHSVRLSLKTSSYKSRYLNTAYYVTLFRQYATQQPNVLTASKN